MVRGELEMKEVRKGKMVKVVRGCKVPKGKWGLHLARRWTVGERVGLEDGEGVVHWTALSNVEVVLNGPPSPVSAESALGVDVSRNRRFRSLSLRNRRAWFSGTNGNGGNQAVGLVRSHRIGSDCRQARYQ